ncbi:hypothetical protein [Homoserinibacter sp. YIM 151385]|uniref:hypothetical protein n=1 Tax=Homoserinibacter sp. YIM 151385 TaxID=2985506 RepID=UPI0022EFF037|nr:hypothetical protein [Homoserinibacter sp. YIM 151385]WBU38985.1 hypothetical protein OF852_05235 [Homoserinibacter sp. YIM 151385]
MAERSEGMRPQVARTLDRRGAMPALVASSAVFAAMLLQNVLHAALATANAAGIGGVTGAGALGPIWQAQLAESFTGALPFALGIFAVLWQIAPIGPELRLAQVVTRALLAAAIGMLVQAALAVLLAILGAATGFPGLFLEAFGGVSTAILDGVIGALHDLVAHAATVVLAAVLLWGWLQRHPRGDGAAGTLDEV